jgi:hypothetical protein
MINIIFQGYINSKQQKRQSVPLSQLAYDRLVRRIESRPPIVNLGERVPPEPDRPESEEEMEVDRDEQPIFVVNGRNIHQEASLKMAKNFLKFIGVGLENKKEL